MSKRTAKKQEQRDRRRRASENVRAAAQSATKPRTARQDEREEIGERAIRQAVASLEQQDFFGILSTSTMRDIYPLEFAGYNFWKTPSLRDFLRKALQFEDTVFHYVMDDLRRLSTIVAREASPVEKIAAQRIAERTEAERKGLTPGAVRPGPNARGIKTGPIAS